MKHEIRRRVSGVDRVFQVLDHLMELSQPARILDIAKGIGAPTSTVYEIVEDLLARNLLTRNGQGLVGLGPKLFHYGLAYRRTTPFLGVARREMERLSHEVGESVQICGRDDDMMVVLAMADGPGHFQVTSKPGTRVPLNWTASGRLLTGHLSSEDRLALYRRAARPSPTGQAETDPERLAAASAKSRAERISIQLSESDFAVACIAAPIVNPTGECVATISIVLPETRAKRDRARYVRAAQAAAAHIEHQLEWDR